MSKVSSYRLHERTIHQMEVLSHSLGIDEKHLIENAIYNYYEKWEEDYNGTDKVIVDFHKNFDGVNTDIVNTFIEEIEEYTHFKVYLFGDGDQVHFILEED